MMTRLLIWGAVLTGLFAVLAPAEAGRKEEIAALQRQVAALENQLQTLSRNSAEMSVQYNQLLAENQQLTGRVETLSNSLRQMETRLDSVTRVLAGENFSGLTTDSVAGNDAFSAGGPYPAGPGAEGAYPPGALPENRPETLTPRASDRAVRPRGGETAGDGAVSSGTASTPVQPINMPGEPNAAYSYASGLLLSGEYDRAQLAFMTYLERYPKSPQAPDALFRLGEIYLATGANADAAQTFIGHIKDYPNDPRAPEAYLKLGTAFMRMGDTDEACSVFKEIGRKFPDASSIVLQRTDIEMQRIECR